MAYLYHATWGKHVRSIRRNGLIPNYRPNDWLASAAERSRRGVFMCEARRADYWETTLYEWTSAPGRIVWLAVDVTGLAVQPDDPAGYAGDWISAQAIEPRRIRIRIR